MPSALCTTNALYLIALPRDLVEHIHYCFDFEDVGETRLRIAACLREESTRKHANNYLSLVLKNKQEYFLAKHLLQS